MIIKKNTLYLVLAFVLIVGAGFFFLKNGNSQEGGNENAVIIENGVQKVTLSMKNYNYYPNTVRVKAGQPVSISLDASVQGCFRDFTIPEFKIREYLPTPQDTVEFTPTEPGTYSFACSMNMGTGRLIVE